LTRTFDLSIITTTLLEMFPGKECPFPCMDN
jgi:hypothetical protein